MSTHTSVNQHTFGNITHADQQAARATIIVERPARTSVSVNKYEDARPPRTLKGGDAWHPASADGAMVLQPT
jgi:hypothetical protein